MEDPEITIFVGIHVTHYIGVRVIGGKEKVAEDINHKFYNHQYEKGDGNHGKQLRGESVMKDIKSWSKRSRIKEKKNAMDYGYK